MWAVWKQLLPHYFYPHICLYKCLLNASKKSGLESEIWEESWFNSLTSYVTTGKYLSFRFLVYKMGDNKNTYLMEFWDSTR